jgi:hypothetical protein
MGLGSEIHELKKLFRVLDPGVKKAPDPGSRIRNTADTGKLRLYCVVILKTNEENSRVWIRNPVARFRIRVQ